MIEYLQLEINGTCKRSCPGCLPAKYKTGRMMTVDEVVSLADQAAAVGVKSAAIAGFGSPVDHPDFDEIVKVLMSKVPVVSMTCRPEELMRTGAVHYVGVSIDSLDDAKDLVEILAASAPTGKSIIPHIVMTDKVGRSIDLLLTILAAWGNKFAQVTVAAPVPLCSDPEYLKVFRESNSNTKQSWANLQSVFPWLSSWSPMKIAVAEPEERMEVCPWLNHTGYFIKANLDIMPCCYLPTVDRIGNLSELSLYELDKKADAHVPYRDFCLKCPQFFPDGD